MVNLIAKTNNSYLNIEGITSGVYVVKVLTYDNIYSIEVIIRYKPL